MIQIIGWSATFLVIFGFLVNALNYRKTAFLLWIIGDILWIYFDVQINNYSHCVLSTFIIFINVYGFYTNKPLDNEV